MTKRDLFYAVEIMSKKKAKAIEDKDDWIGQNQFASEDLLESLELYIEFMELVDKWQSMRQKFCRRFKALARRSRHEQALCNSRLEDSKDETLP